MKVWHFWTSLQNKAECQAYTSNHDLCPLELEQGQVSNWVSDTIKGALDTGHIDPGAVRMTLPARFLIFCCKEVHFKTFCPPVITCCTQAESVKGNPPKELIVIPLSLCGDEICTSKKSTKRSWETVVSFSESKICRWRSSLLKWTALSYWMEHLQPVLQRQLLREHSFCSVCYWLVNFLSTCFIVLTKGQSVSKYYRFLVRNGGWVWLQTKANIVYDSKTCQPQFVLCTNYIIM